MALNPDCPVCQQNGLPGKLRRFHINFEESITLCANEKCTYPLGVVNTNDLIRKPKNFKKEAQGKKEVSSGKKHCDSAQNGYNFTKQLSPWRGKTDPKISTPKVLSGYTPGLSQKNIIPVTWSEVKVEDRHTPKQGKDRVPDSPESDAITPVPSANFKAAVSVRKTSPEGRDILAGHASQIKTSLVGVAPSVPELDKKSPILCGKNDDVNGQNSVDIERSLKNGGQCNQRANSGKGGKLTVQEDHHAQQKNIVENVDVLSKWYLQWENRDALCWLDVVLCLLVQSRSVKTAVELSLKSSSGTDPGTRKMYIVRTLLAAYDQAMALSKSLFAEREKLRISPKLESEELSTNQGNTGVLAEDKSTQQQGTESAKVSRFKDNSSALPSPSGRTSKKLVLDLSKPVQPTSNGGVPLKMGAGQIQSPNLAFWAEIMVRDPGFLKARSILNGAREQVWQVLQPKLQCEKGRKDSPVFAIPLLLHTDSDICHLFETTYKFETKCSICGNTKIERYTKVLPTLPKVVEDFSMHNVSHWRDCFFCSAPNQKRQLHFEKLSQCVMIHFVEGLPSSDLTTLHFSLSGQSYQVSSLIQYKNDPSHFVIWIKHPSGDYWMECDDLDGPLCKFEGQIPNLPAGQIHVVFWERLSGSVKSGTDQKAANQSERQCVKSQNVRSKKKAAVVESCGSVAEKEASLKSIATKEPVHTQSGEDKPRTTETKAVPPAAVRKTFALLKQMKSKNSRCTLSADVSTSSSPVIREALYSARPCARESTRAESGQSNTPFAASQRNLNPLAAFSASVSNKTRSKTNGHTQVFEGYKSKGNLCNQKQKNSKNTEEVIAGDDSRTSGTNVRVDKQCRTTKQLSAVEAVPVSQTNADPPSGSVCKKPDLKRKGTVPLLPRKKLRSSCHLEKAEGTDLESLPRTSVDGHVASSRTEIQVTVLSPKRPDVKSAEDTPQNMEKSAISESNLEQSIEDLVLPDWVEVSEDQSKTDLSDLLSSALPELSEFLSEDYKGHNSSSTAQTEILQDLYNALDLNVSAESNDVTGLFETTQNQSDECSMKSSDLEELFNTSQSLQDEYNPFDALLSL